MSTTINEPALPNAGHGEVTDKVEECFLEAKQKFDNGDYAAVVHTLEEVPETLFTKDMKDLHEQSTQLKRAALQLETAKRSFTNGDYSHAQTTLEQIPEDLRSPEINQLLEKTSKQSCIKEAMSAAEKSLEVYDYDEIIRLLEEVPKPDRSDELLGILQDAYTKRRQLGELQTEIDAKLAEAEKTLDAEFYADVLPLLQQLLDLNPKNSDVRDQLDEVQSIVKQIDDRDQIFEKAKDQFAERDYQAVIDLLNPVPKRLRTGKISRCLDTALENQQKIGDLSTESLEAIREGNFSEILPRLDQLDDLKSDPAGGIVEQLGPGEFENFLARLSKCCGPDPNLRVTLDHFVDVLTTDKIVEITAQPCAKDIIDNYPDEGRLLPKKLVQILDELTEDSQKFKKRIKALQFARKLLRGDACRLDNWETFIQALGHFEKSQKKSWKWTDTLVENPKTVELEADARSLAEAAVSVLPKDIDRWECLQEITDGQLDKKRAIFRRVYGKIEQFLKTPQWSPVPITLITLRRALQALGAVVLLTIVGSLAQVLLSLLFDVGGTRGYVAVFSLAAIWFFLCRGLNKLL